MSSNRLFVIFMAIAAIVPMAALATEYIVGDEMGWTIGYDYQGWAEGKTFMVGDTLVFKYPVGDHNVFKVNGTSFQNCHVPTQNEAMTSGNDRIVLATPGKKWYICGVGMHCQVGGQKLVIIVQPPSMAPAPSPMSSSTWGSKRPFFNFGW